MKKTVGIITIHNIENFGSVLQTYATQYVINALGFDCKIIDYKYPNDYHNGYLDETKSKVDCVTPRRNLSLMEKIINKCLKIIYKTKIKKNRLETKRSFVDFTDNFLNKTSTYNTFEELEKNPPVFDVYVVGSDQVWNVKYAHMDKAWLLSYISDDRKRISYASSFGSFKIPLEYSELYRMYLSKFSAISVREASGVDIVKELINKQAYHTLDPTLLLSSNDWNKIALPIKIQRPYIYCYLLSYSTDPFPYVYDLIEKVQKQLQCKVVIHDGNLLDCTKRGFLTTSTIQNIGPLEFLSLIKNANFVITSSFHGTAFAINYRKSFFSIVDKRKTDDRIESLLTKLELTERLIPIGTSTSSLENFNINYTKTEAKLNENIRYSVNYLKSNL